MTHKIPVVEPVGTKTDKSAVVGKVKDGSKLPFDDLLKPGDEPVDMGKNPAKVNRLNLMQSFKRDTDGKKIPLKAKPIVNRSELIKNAEEAKQNASPKTESTDDVKKPEAPQDSLKADAPQAVDQAKGDSVDKPVKKLDGRELKLKPAGQDATHSKPQREEIGEAPVGVPAEKAVEMVPEVQKNTEHIHPQVSTSERPVVQRETLSKKQFKTLTTPTQGVGREDVNQASDRTKENPVAKSKVQSSDQSQVVQEKNIKATPETQERIFKSPMESEPNPAVKSARAVKADERPNLSQAVRRDQQAQQPQQALQSIVDESGQPTATKQSKQNPLVNPIPSRNASKSESLKDATPIKAAPEISERNTDTERSITRENLAPEQSTRKVEPQLANEAVRAPRSRVSSVETQVHPKQNKNEEAQRPVEPQKAVEAQREVEPQKADLRAEKFELGNSNRAEQSQVAHTRKTRIDQSQPTTPVKENVALSSKPTSIDSAKSDQLQLPGLDKNESVSRESATQAVQNSVASQEVTVETEVRSAQGAGEAVAAQVTAAKAEKVDSRTKPVSRKVKGSATISPTQHLRSKRSAQMKEAYGPEPVADKGLQELEENPADILKQQLRDRIEILKKAQESIQVGQENLPNQNMHNSMSMKNTPEAGLIQSQMSSVPHPRVNAPLFARSFTAEMVNKIREMSFETSNDGKAQKASFIVDGGPLGELDIEFHTEATREEITIFVESDLSKNELQRVMPHIEDNMNQRGFSFSNVNVEVKDDQRSSGSMGDGDAHTSNSNDESAERDQATAEENEANTKRNYGYNTMEVLA